jgi:thiamine transport system ATP-binding protein
MAEVGARTPTLAVDAVSVRYGEHLALDAVDVAVGDGEVVALLGPSGCGKTTLLRAIAGLVAPASGRVLLDGVDITAVAPHRRGIGLMFQEYALFPHRDVAANVGFGLAVRKEPKARVRARVGEVLELVGLAGYERRAVGQLSGGEQQRVALARALAPSPRVLMLDEPLGALDRALRDRLVVDLQHLFAELGITVVYVTHDQGEALALADRVVVMDAGTIAQDGSPVDVWRRPASPSVARLLGLANIVDVEVRSGELVAPWGSLGSAPGTADGAAQVVIRPDAVRLAPVDPGRTLGPGELAGHVVGRTFRGDRVVVQVRVGDAGPVIDVSVAPTEAPTGEPAVRVAIDPAGVTLLGAS